MGKAVSRSRPHLYRYGLRDAAPASFYYISPGNPVPDQNPSLAGFSILLSYRSSDHFLILCTDDICYLTELALSRHASGNSSIYQSSCGGIIPYRKSRDALPVSSTLSIFHHQIHVSLFFREVGFSLLSSFSHIQTESIIQVNMVINKYFLHDKPPKTILPILLTYTFL